MRDLTPTLSISERMDELLALEAAHLGHGPKAFHGTERTAGTRRGLSLAAAKGDRFRPFPALKRLLAHPDQLPRPRTKTIWREAKCPDSNLAVS